MNPLGSRTRAEELARLLEGAVSGPASSGAAYATLATRLRRVAPALDDAFVPRAEFRAALRQRLLAVASVQSGAQVGAAVEPRGKALVAAVAWTRTWKAQGRIALTAGAMAGVVAFTGVGIASSRSLPGQPFYGLKRAVEGLQLDMATGDTAKGTKHLEFASTRLREVRALASGENELALGTPGTPTAAGLALGGSVAQRITRTLRAFDNETRDGKALLERAYRRTGKTDPLKVLSTFSTQQQHRLTALLPELPLSTTAAARQSLALVTSVGTTADQLLAIGTCSAQCDPSGAAPVLQPAPSPGASASPTLDNSGDTNGVPPCTCGGEPSPTPQPAAQPDPQDSETPSPSPSPSRTSSPTPAPSSSPTPLLPEPLPTILPTDLPTILPTGFPLPLPSLTALLQPVDAIKP